MSGTKRNLILDDAHDVVYSERNNLYGNPYDNFVCLSDMIAAIVLKYLRRNGMPDFEWPTKPGPELAALVMAALKITRIAGEIDSDCKDHWTDLAGYAENGYAVETQRRHSSNRKARQGGDENSGS